MDRDTTFSLINAHGRTEEMLFFATLIDDYERKISHYISQGDFRKVLTVLDVEVIKVPTLFFLQNLFSHSSHSFFRSHARPSTCLKQKPRICSIASHRL